MFLVIDQNASQAQWEFELTDSSRFFTIPSAPSKASGEVPPWLKNEATDTIKKKEMKEGLLFSYLHNYDI